MSLLRPRDLPSDVAASISRFLTSADDEEPGLVEAVWVEGSIVLGDYHPDVSDMDVVVMTKRPLAPRERLRVPAPLSVTWTTRGTLSALPPITAATLHRAGVAVRGPIPRALVPDVPRATLVAYVADNLATYWQPWLARARRPLFRLTCLHPRRVQWGVFGVPRQYVTALDGSIVSKTAAARRVRDLFDARHHRILDEALRLRTGAGARQYRSPFARAAAMVAFLEHAIERTHAVLGVGVRAPARSPGEVRQGLVTAATPGR